jgi:hypothetical protein
VQSQVKTAKKQGRFTGRTTLFDGAFKIPRGCIKKILTSQAVARKKKAWQIGQFDNFFRNIAYINSGQNSEKGGVVNWSNHSI